MAVQPRGPVQEHTIGQLQVRCSCWQGHDWHLNLREVKQAVAVPVEPRLLRKPHLHILHRHELMTQIYDVCMLVVGIVRQYGAGVPADSRV